MLSKHINQIQTLLEHLPTNHEALSSNSTTGKKPSLHLPIPLLHCPTTTMFMVVTRCSLHRDIHACFAHLNPFLLLIPTSKDSSSHFCRAILNSVQTASPLITLHPLKSHVPEFVISLLEPCPAIASVLFNVSHHLLSKGTHRIV
jgi:hypothetical protein